MDSESLTRSDRRRYNRLNLNFPFAARDLSGNADEGWQEFAAENISAGGVYFSAPSEITLKVGDEITIDAAPPESTAEHFPFSRFIGKAKVIRLDKVTDGSGKTKKKIGVALEFDPTRMEFLLR